MTSQNVQSPKSANLRKTHHFVFLLSCSNHAKHGDQTYKYKLYFSTIEIYQSESSKMLRRLNEYNGTFMALPFSNISLHEL